MAVTPLGAVQIMNGAFNSGTSSWSARHRLVSSCPGHKPLPALGEFHVLLELSMASYVGNITFFVVPEINLHTWAELILLIRDVERLIELIGLLLIQHFTPGLELLPFLLAEPKGRSSSLRHCRICRALCCACCR